MRSLEDDLAFFLANNWEAVESPTAFPAVKKKGMILSRKSRLVGWWNMINFWRLSRAAVSPSVRWNMIKFAGEHLRNRYMYWSVEVDPWLIRFFLIRFGGVQDVSQTFPLFIPWRRRLNCFKMQMAYQCIASWKMGFCWMWYVSAIISRTTHHLSWFFSDQLGHLGIFVPLALKTKGHSRFFIGIPVVGLK